MYVHLFIAILPLLLINIVNIKKTTEKSKV